MFDPDGDQAAADSTRSSTSLDTGSSLNPRTARRLVTASYTSMIATFHWLSVSFNASVVPKRRHATEDIASDGNVAHGWEGQMCCHQRLPVRRQLPQKIDPHAGRLLGVVFEAVVPVGVLEPDLEHEVPGERQPVAAGRQADHAVPGGVAAGAMDENPRRHLVLLVERPQLTLVLVQKPLSRLPKRVREPRRHVDAGEIGAPVP